MEGGGARSPLILRCHDFKLYILLILWVTGQQLLGQLPMGSTAHGINYHSIECLPTRATTPLPYGPLKYLPTRIITLWDNDPHGNKNILHTE